jgi:hypothetical protein
VNSCSLNKASSAQSAGLKTVQATSTASAPATNTTSATSSASASNTTSNKPASASAKPKPKPSTETDRLKFAGRIVPGWTDPRQVPPLSLLLFDILFQCKQDVDAELDRTAKPYFPKILFSCLEKMTKVADPTPQLLLLRSMFTHISARWDQLYADFQPLAPKVFQTLNNMLLVSCECFKLFIFTKFSFYLA